MFKKLSLYLIGSVFLCVNVWAIPNSAEYTRCMARESSDSGTAQCYENEIKYFEDMTKDNLKYIKEWNRYEKLVQSKEFNIDVQYQAFNDFLDSFCEYYVASKQNQGYSDRYLNADCRLGYTQMFAGYLKGLIVKGSDSCGEGEE